MINVNDLIGKTYNRLTVVKYHGKKNGRTFWECLCSCGKIHIVVQGNLINGHTKSCGCLMAEVYLTINKTHGRTHTKEYRAWHHAKERCYNKKDPRYHTYGARGIKMCDRWINSFENFFADMGLAPSKKHTLDRKENDKDYSPDNCRWTTNQENCNNKSNNVLITHKGETKTQSQWAKLLGVSHGTIKYRMKAGWSMDEVLS